MLPFAFLAIASLLLVAWGGGMFPGALHAACMLVCAGCALVGLRKGRTEPGRCAPTLLALLLVILAVATAIPLPRALGRIVDANRADQNALVEEAIEAARKLDLVSDGPAPRFSFTRHRAGTWKAILLAVCCLGTVVLGSSIPYELRRRYLAFMVITGAVIVLAGDVSQWIIPQGKRIWWIPAFAVQHGRPVGCFANRNHFGGFAGVHALLVCGLMGDSIARRKTWAMVGWGLLFMALSVSVFTSLSRGAVVAYGAGMGLVVPAAIFRRRWGMLAAIGVCALVIVGGGVLAYTSLDSSGDGSGPEIIAAGGRVADRVESLGELDETDSARSRLSTWGDCLAMWRQYPLFGVGVNAMRMVYQQYETLATRKHFFHAENEYVQLLAETGVAGVILAVALAALLIRTRTSRGEGGFSDDILLAITAAIVSVFVHASVEFALRRPVYAVAVCSLVGLRLRPQAACSDRVPMRWLWMVVCAGVLFSLVWLRPVYRFDEPEVIAEGTADEVARSLVWAPTSSQAWYDLGRASWESSDAQRLSFGEKCISTAVVYDPNNYLVWEELGNIRRYLGDKQGALAAYERMHEIRPWKQVPEL